MTDQHLITPPFEMVEEWARMLEYHRDEQVFSKIAQWGADQELEACCEWVRTTTNTIGLEDHETLRAARRPKPPSLREQALAALDDAVMRGDCITISDALPTLRRALNELPDA